MYHRSQASSKFIDCKAHGVGSELYLVEGDSAAASVATMRDERTQAVLPLQGKPLNAWKASSEKVAAYPLYTQLASALGLASPLAMSESESQKLRFGNIYLLFDPDADGIHIGALVLLYFKRWLPALLDSGRIHMLRAPMFNIQLADAETGEVQQHYAYTPAQAEVLRKMGQEKQLQLISNMMYRGLGSLPPELLRETCITPATRKADVVTAAQMQMVVDVFGAV